MRKIKFRAWDKDAKRFLSDTEMNEVGGFYYSYGVTPPGDMFCMGMFTCLRDKNGKEVYEGDFIRWSGHSYLVTVDEYHGFRFMFGVDQFSRYHAIYGEVVGNIHENPELLERKA